MGLADLMTLAEVEAMRRGKPLPKGPTRLESKAAKDAEDVHALERWKRAVRIRDKHRCRVCGCRTKVTLELVPQRSEVHHIVSRADTAVRYDVRNGVLVCKKDHDRLTRRQLHIVGTAASMYVVNGVHYINGSGPLQFKAKQ